METGAADFKTGLYSSCRGEAATDLSKSPELFFALQMILKAKTVIFFFTF